MKRRLMFLCTFLLFLFAGLILQFYKIQIVEGDKWVEAAHRQHYCLVKEPFRRGTFLGGCLNPHVDRVAHPLAIDLEKFHLYADPLAIPESLKGEVSHQVSLLLALKTTEERKVLRNVWRKSHSRKLVLWLEDSQKREILKWWNPFARQHKLARNALFFVSDYRRSYPYGKLLGQIIHTVQPERDEKTGQAVPTGGLELSFDAFLKGHLGKRRLIRSPRHALENDEVLVSPQHGKDLYLTIDPVIQAITEEELEKGVKAAHAKAGWAVMMDPYTGDIWAMAQYPFFYPSDYAKIFNDPAALDSVRCKAITDANEPGSSMKTITLAIALKANKELQRRGEMPLFDPLEMMPTANGKFPGRSKPISDTRLHNFLNFDMAMQRSSNIYPARLVERMIQRLGVEWYRNQLSQGFGIGMKTGVELPAESGGVLPTPGKLHPNGKPEWSVPTPFSMAFGHNIQVTTMQLVRAYAIFANGGKLVKPRLVKKIGEEWVVREEGEPILDPEVAIQVLKALKYTTKQAGTSQRADIPFYTEAGKSGTANKVIGGTYAQKSFVSSFIGIAPTTQPLFVLVVSMDEPEYGYIPGRGKNHHGGNCGGPVFREVGKRTLAYLGVTPDDPKKNDWVAETRSLQEIYDKWNKKETHAIKKTP